MRHDPADRINLQMPEHRVIVRVGDATIADTEQSVELRETGYPPRQYIPREHTDTSILIASDTQTHCPFKGDAQYYSAVLGNRVIADVAWSYKQPFAAMADIAGRFSFDPEKVKQLITPTT